MNQDARKDLIRLIEMAKKGRALVPEESDSLFVAVGGQWGHVVACCFFGAAVIGINDSPQRLGVIEGWSIIKQEFPSLCGVENAVKQLMMINDNAPQGHRDEAVIAFIQTALLE